MTTTVDTPRLRPLATRREVAEFLGVSEQALRRWARDGFGPPYVKYGHAVRYRREAVETWLSSREAQSVSAHIARDEKDLI